MAKFENELDLSAAKISVSKHKDKILQIIAVNPDLSKIVKTLTDNSNLNCYIFSKSVAFRVGKSSIKSIPNYPDGFKTSFGSGQEAKDVFTPYKFNSTLSKSNVVIIIAAYYLIFHSDRTKSESDKTEAVESEQVVQTQGQLKKLVKEYGEVKLVVGDASYSVDDFSQVSGRPKADMVFSHKGTNVIFVSHKKGGKPGDFQQYGGFAADLNIKVRADAKKYRAIDKFLSEIEQIMVALDVPKDNNGRYDLNYLKKGSNFAKLIDDEDVANTVMFGKDFSKGKVGLDNCSILIDGDIVFTPVKGKGLNVFKLEGSYHTTVNPTLIKNKPMFKADPNDIYSPAMFLMKSEAQGLNQGGFANARAVIWPNNNVIRSYSSLFKDVYSAVKSKNAKKIEEIRKKLVK